MRCSKKPQRSSVSNIDQIHRAVCVITLITVVGLFAYVINLTRAVSDGILTREHVFSEVKENVQKNTDQISQLVHVQEMQTHAVGTINEDLLKIHASVEAMDAKLTDVLPATHPSTEPSK
jgi:hypothetical protein